MYALHEHNKQESIPLPRDLGIEYIFVSIFLKQTGTWPLPVLGTCTVLLKVKPEGSHICYMDPFICGSGIMDEQLLRGQGAPGWSKL